MSNNDLTLSDVQDLTNKVEYLVHYLKLIHEDSPQIDRVASRIEKATDRFDHSIKHGMHQIEGIIFNLDYSKLKEGLYYAVRDHTFELDNTLSRMKDHNKVLAQQFQHTNDVIAKNEKLLHRIDHTIEHLVEETKAIPLLHQRLLIAMSSLSFVAGVAALYALSLIMWLPQPYYATPEQAQLLQMVQDKTLHLVPDALDTFKVTLTPSNITTGENQ